jgi:hypothetical protein
VHIKDSHLLQAIGMSTICKQIAHINSLMSSLFAPKNKSSSSFIFSVKIFSFLKIFPKFFFVLISSPDINKAFEV